MTASVVVRVAGVLVAVVAVVLVLAWTFQRRLIYLPSGAPPTPAGVEQVLVPTDDGLELAAWWLPARGTDRGRAVLVAPGNAGSRADRVPLARSLSGAGFGVLLLEYRGYGGNPGTPSEDGLAADARAAHRHLVEERGLAPGDVVVLGESLGAAVAVRLARERPVGGLVLRSPFTSLADVGAVHYPVLPVRWLLRDRFDVLGAARSPAVPVAVVAGGADEVVPVGQSRAVAQAAGASYVEVPGARHNDASLGAGPQLVAAVVGVSGPG